MERKPARKRKRKDLPRHVYPHGRKGYLYFRLHGRTVRLPDIDDPAFWGKYDEVFRAFEGNPLLKVQHETGMPINRNELDQYFAKLERGAKQRSARKGLEYTLPKYWGADQYTKQFGKCAISGLVMRKPETPWDHYGPSIDRINSDKGYTPENCQLVLLSVNRAKNEMPGDDFVGMCRAVVEHAKRQLANVA